MMEIEHEELDRQNIEIEAFEYWLSQHPIRRAFMAHQLSTDSVQVDGKFLYSNEFMFWYKVSEHFRKNPTFFLAGLVAFIAVIGLTLIDFFNLVADLTMQLLSYFV